MTRQTIYEPLPASGLFCFSNPRPTNTMQIINPTWKAAHQSTDPLRARAKHRWWLKDQAAAGEYLKGTHKFEMWHNQERTGDFRIMTGLEAKVLNDNHKQDFRKEIQRVYPAYVKVPLKHWTLVEKFTKETRVEDEQNELLSETHKI